jgi:hypothetical protein
MEFITKTFKNEYTIYSTISNRKVMLVQCTTCRFTEPIQSTYRTLLPQRSCYIFIVVSTPHTSFLIFGNFSSLFQLCKHLTFEIFYKRNYTVCDYLRMVFSFTMIPLRSIPDARCVNHSLLPLVIVTMVKT